jgi:hypothetical protein
MILIEMNKEKKNIVTGKKIKKPNCRYMYDKPKFNRQKKKTQKTPFNVL